MDSLSFNKIRGAWVFSDYEKINIDHYKNHIIYENSETILSEILKLLSASKLLIPMGVCAGSNILFESSKISEIINFIFQEDKRFGYVGICGHSIIFTSENEKVYKNLFQISEFDLIDKNLIISLRSDIILPMLFDEDSFSFNWNLEKYNLNYYRLPKVLNDIKNLLNWDSDNSDEIDYTERGCVQVGYDLFLSEDVITREYAENPNPDFNLQEYVSKIKSAISALQDENRN